VYKIGAKFGLISLSPPSAAEYFFQSGIIFEISLREISKMMPL